MSERYLIVLCGPTAVGKTQVALSLADVFNSEIISADSRQLFKEMSIGTAKPTVDELMLVYHHFVGTHSIKDEYSAGVYGVEASRVIEQLFEDKDILVMVGGSGLYIKSVLDGLDEFPDVDPSVREKLKHQFESEGLEVLQDQLQCLDPAYYATVDTKNPHRLIRALEISIGTGKPYSSYRLGVSKKRSYTPIKIGLELERSELYDRIDRRVEAMIDTGLLKEIEELYSYRDFPALNTVGYTELFEHLEGKVDLKTAVDAIKQNTRRYAKRQLTWFKRDDEITWYHASGVANIYKDILDRIS